MNATLNATSALFILFGFVAVRSKRIKLHRALMVTALIASTLFLISYLYYHSQVGSVKFQGQGLIRPVYFTILITHTSLAVAILPLVLVTVYRALREDFARHKRIARWTFPIWLYVSVTGIVVYTMLYHL